MRFKELIDEQWEFVRPLLPSPARTGRPRAGDRRTIHAILYVLTTGCRWMDLPGEYGDDSTANLRLRKWEKMGVWKKMLKRIVEKGYALERLSLEELVVDSSDVAAKKGGSSSGMTAIRRSRAQRFMLL